MGMPICAQVVLVALEGSPERCVAGAAVALDAFADLLRGQRHGGMDQRCDEVEQPFELGVIADGQRFADRVRHRRGDELLDALVVRP